MFTELARCLLFSFALLPSTAWAAEPTKLKLSFFSSDTAVLYGGGVKPFVDAINSEAKGLLEIEVFFRGALGKPAQQPQLVRDGVADIAFILPGYTADQFPDNAVIELPGLFRDQREASLAYTRMIAANALRGYEDFFVITAFTVEPHSIHTRQPIASLEDLKGLKIRANNPTEAATFEKLGMRGIVMPANQIADAIGSGAIDGAALPPAMLVVKTIVTLGRELNMRVTVEGVETAQQATFLDGINADQVQGFFFGRPVSGLDVSVEVLKDLQRRHAKQSTRPAFETDGLSRSTSPQPDGLPVRAKSVRA